jgi:Na+-translocating ferredoxin:NAD+ oxidoreductase RnfC subunit
MRAVYNRAMTCSAYLSLQIFEGIRIALKILGKPAFVGIEKNKPEAIKTSVNRSKPFRYPNRSSDPLRTKYPQGAENSL